MIDENSQPLQARKLVSLLKGERETTPANADVVGLHRANQSAHTTKV